MRKYLLPDSGNFYKANLHVHTTVSDGQMTPEEIKRIYKEHGYSIVAFTDHEIMVPEPHLTDGEFLAITSTEISVNSHHGWAIDRLAPNLRVVARSKKDNVIEAVEDKERRIFATQWHPELSYRMGDPIEKKFFENFIRLCANK